jgi:DNA-binding NarL/FixJ family response regulator
MINVMLVDDQNLVRKGVRSLLELSEEIEVIAEAADGAEAIKTIPEVNPDVVLLDMRMPGKSGLDVLRELSDTDNLPPTIILTTFDDDELLLAGIQAGAKGFLLKDVALAELVSAVKTVAEGGSVVKPAVTQRLLKGLENLHTDFYSLDRKERSKTTYRTSSPKWASGTAPAPSSRPLNWGRFNLNN